MSSFTSHFSFLLEFIRKTSDKQHFWVTSWLSVNVRNGNWKSILQHNELWRRFQSGLWMYGRPWAWNFITGVILLLPFLQNTEENRQSFLEKKFDLKQRIKKCEVIIDVRRTELEKLQKKTRQILQGFRNILIFKLS